VVLWRGVNSSEPLRNQEQPLPLQGGTMNGFYIALIVFILSFNLFSYTVSVKRKSKFISFTQGTSLILLVTALLFIVAVPNAPDANRLETYHDIQALADENLSGHPVISSIDYQVLTWYNQRISLLKEHAAMAFWFGWSDETVILIDGLSPFDLKQVKANDTFDSHLIAYLPVNTIRKIYL
jgi:hypothetical protein